MLPCMSKWQTNSTPIKKKIISFKWIAPYDFYGSKYKQPCASLQMNHEMSLKCMYIQKCGKSQGKSDYS